MRMLDRLRTPQRQAWPLRACSHLRELDERITDFLGHVGDPPGDRGDRAHAGQHRDRVISALI